jgi:hypothetical protein
MIYSNSRRFLPLFLVVGFVLVGLVFVNQASAGGGCGICVSSAVNDKDNSYVDIGLSNSGGFWGDSGKSTPIASSSLDIYDSVGVATTSVQILSVTNTSGGALVGGETTVRVLINVGGTINYTDTLSAQLRIGPAASYEIYGSTGAKIAYNYKPIFTLHNPLAPKIVSAAITADNSYVDITFNKGVWGDAGASTPLDSSKIYLSIVLDPDSSATSWSISSATKNNGSPLVGGETTIRAVLGVTILSGDEILKLTIAENSVFSEDGDPDLAAKVTDWIWTIPITITESGDSTDVTEGGATDSYTVVLSTQPTDDVEITIAPDAQLDASPTTLTFTDADWDTPQTVTVTAVNDSVVEGNHTGTITHTALSSDPNYNGISIADITANITDNDRAASGGRRDPVVVNWSYGSGYGPETSTSTATSTTITSTSTPETSTSTPSTPSVANLQQQINTLLNQLNALILQAKARGLSVPAGGVYAFVRDLDLGTIGEDVRQLQIYLNTHRFVLVLSGPGSPGNETTHFGPATKAALIKFQQASGISPALGYFGPLTRAYILSHP